MIPIALIENCVLNQPGLKAQVKDIPNIHIVGEANTGAQALHLVQQHKSPVILVDSDWLDIGGLEMTRRLLQHDASVKIIILSASQNYILANHFLWINVAAYLYKDKDITQEIQDALMQVRTGNQCVSKAIIDQNGIECEKDIATKYFKEDG